MREDGTRKKGYNFLEYNFFPIFAIPFLCLLDSNYD